MDVIDWLLDSDPAIRWQALRDLTDASAAEVAGERARVPHQGLGAQILAHQGADGAWHHRERPSWFSTLHSGLLLRATGIDPTDPLVEAAMARLAAGFRWAEEHGARPFFGGEVEPCINGGALALGAYFGRPEAALARRLCDEQLGEGGWNCDAPPSTRASFHSTLCVLDGLLAYERAVPAAPAVSQARRRGEEYLLERSLLRRRSNGQVIDPSFFAFAFPTRHYYDLLRCLDYFRDAGAAPDPRMDEALRLLTDKRQADGTWLLESSHPEALDFAFGERVGEPSRWITLRALRVLSWGSGSSG